MDSLIVSSGIPLVSSRVISEIFPEALSVIPSISPIDSFRSSARDSFRVSSGVLQIF